MSYEKYQYPDYAMDLARRRVRDLLSVYHLSVASFENIVMSAYLQGLVDAFETLGEEKKED